MIGPNNLDTKPEHLTILQFGLVHHFTKLGSGEYYLEELEHEVTGLVLGTCQVLLGIMKVL